MTRFSLEFFGSGVWGTHSSPEFWDWFWTQDAKPGDHLIFQVIDGEAKRYAVRFERRTERDEAAIAARNQVVLKAALKRARRSSFPFVWEIAAHLLVTGLYQDPIPPDPIQEIWHADVWEDAEEDRTIEDSREPAATLRNLFGQEVQVYDFENPPDLPREYDPEKGRRRPRLSRRAREQSVQSYVLRVNHRALPEVWREIELAEDNTLEDLHLVIQQAFSWWDDHLYSFFLSGQPWDQRTEIGSPWSDAPEHTHHVQIGQLDLRVGQTFLYLFDYGDQHEFDVNVQDIHRLAPKGEYPRVLTYQGTSPPQYPDFDEETGEPSWDPHRHW
jgi:hypothetical protein